MIQKNANCSIKCVFILFILRSLSVKKEYVFLSHNGETIQNFYFKQQKTYFSSKRASNEIKKYDINYGEKYSFLHVFKNIQIL